MDLTINVGLGNADPEQRYAALAQILAIQEKLIQGGGMGTLVDANKIYNTISKIVEVAGYKSPEQFFINPANIPPQPPKQKEQNPLVGVALQELELNRQKAMADIQLQQQKLEADIAIQKQKILADIEKQKIKNEGDIQEALIKRGMR